MKKNIPTIIAALSCLLTLLCLFRISALEDRIYSLQNNLTNMQNVLRDDIRNISSNVLSSVEEGNNLLSTSSYSLEDPNLEGGTVDLSCIVTLKEFEPEGTTAVLTCNDTEDPMNLKGGDFVAKFPISIFEVCRVTQVSFTKDGVVRTQALDWYINPRDQFVPNLYANMSGTSTGSGRDGVYSWHKNGTLHVSVEQKGGLVYEVSRIDLVQEVDGEESQRRSLLGEVRENTTVFGKTPAATITNKDPLELELDIDEDFNCPYGSTLLIYVELIDESGYIHRAIVDEISVTEEGQLDDDRIPLWHGAQGNIYDSEGNLLYGIDWEKKEYSYLYK